MHAYLGYVLFLPFWVICVQFYFHAVSQKGELKQNECRMLGIVFTTIGVGSLVFRDVWYVMSGLVLIMLGLRLIATSLERMDKRVFIDRYEEE